MAAVLDLDPIRRPAGTIRAISTLRHQPLKPHVAGSPKQIRANLALFERRNENAIGPTSQQPGEVGLAHRERKLSQVLAVERQDIEGIELHLVIVIARVQRVEIGNAVTASTTASSPSITNWMPVTT